MTMMRMILNDARARDGDGQGGEGLGESEACTESGIQSSWGPAWSEQPSAGRSAQPSQLLKQAHSAWPACPGSGVTNSDLRRGTQAGTSRY